MFQVFVYLFYSWDQKHSDGRSPGLKRVEDLGLEAVVFPSPGTSEDIAMLAAYEYKAKLIVALGTHAVDRKSVV